MWQAIGLKSNRLYYEDWDKRGVIFWLNKSFPSDSKCYPIYQDGNFYNVLPEKIGLFRVKVTKKGEVE